MYSQATNHNLSTVNGPSITPRTTGLFGAREQTRSHSSPHSSTAHLPLHSQPIPMSYSPVAPPIGWDQPEMGGIRHPQPAVLQDDRPIQQESLVSGPSGTSERTGSLESGTSTRASRPRRPRKKRRHHRHHQQRGWVRQHRSGTPPASRNRHFLHDAPKGDNSRLSVFVAALFLLATLITCKIEIVTSLLQLIRQLDLAIALSVKGLGQELHILFGLTLAGAVIFLGHSIFRLHRAKKRRQRREERRRNQTLEAKLGDRNGFAPTVPIRVHLARDEEFVASDEAAVVAEKATATAVPPPAYGLWRSSVVSLAFPLVIAEIFTKVLKESQSRAVILATGACHSERKRKFTSSDSNQ
jgi:hypothetical protein